MKKKQKKLELIFASIGYQLDKLMVFVENDFESRNEMLIRFEEEILSSPNHTLIYMEII